MTSLARRCICACPCMQIAEFSCRRYNRRTKRSNAQGTQRNHVDSGRRGLGIILGRRGGALAHSGPYVHNKGARLCVLGITVAAIPISGRVKLRR